MTAHTAPHAAGSDSVTPVLHTARLTLRGWTEADRAPFAALNSDPDVMRHFPSPLMPPESDAMVARIIAKWSSDGHGLWAVERDDTREFIGFVGLVTPTWEMPFTPCVEVGWRLAKQHWGQGFAPEAARAAIDWGFANIELPRDEIVSFTTEANSNSRRVMEKLGLTYDPADDFDHPLLESWHGRRHVLYRIDRQGWAARR